MTGHGDLHGRSASDYENNSDAAALADAVIELGAQRAWAKCLPNRCLAGACLSLNSAGYPVHNGAKHRWWTMPLPDWSGRVSRLKTALLPDQVADDVRRQIRGREMTDRIPSEQHLAQMYSVSRITVRRALEKLADEGLVVTVRGRGTFVASQND